MKASLVCDDWKALHRNTLLGFASIKIPELHLTIRDIAIHQKNGHRWAQLPAKPQIKDGAVVKDSTGRVVYFPMLAFDSREVANAFSAAVIDAILVHEPDAFSADDDQPPPRRQQPPPRDPMSDEIPF
jgi:hypothetical protein